jgi:hypothetical protein
MVVSYMMKITVSSAQMGAVAGFIKGHIDIDGLTVNFVGTAYGRFSGHNISVRFSPAAKKKMVQRGLDPEQVALDAQQALITGSFELTDNSAASE